MEKNKLILSRNIMLVIIFVICTVALCCYNNMKYTHSIEDFNNEITINNPNQTRQEIKVLVINIDPVLTQVEGTNLPQNKKVSEHFGQSAQVSIDEIVEDLEFTSHGYIDINVYKTEYLNEFPTYTSHYAVPSNNDIITEEVSLPDGRIGYRIKEQKYIEYAYDNNTKKLDWYTLYSNHVLDPWYFSFDYKYIIDKYDLINRRKNKEFDQVWLVSIDPISSYEAIMVGNNPYWANAPGYVADCENFLISSGVSMSRRDAQLHALGHGVEGIMNAAFNRGYTNYYGYLDGTTFKYYTTQYNAYSENQISINNYEQYNELNMWEKFMLNKYNNTENYTSVGNVHFPFNGTSDYDYENKTNVYTNWREWLNYPNMNDNFELANNSAWQNNEINNILGADEEKSPDRLYMRFWFYLMPHVDGYTSDGHLNNWWKYFYSLDFVDRLNVNGSTTLNVKKNNHVVIDLDIIYNSLNVDKVTHIKEGNNIKIDNPNILGYKNGYLYGKNSGSTKVTLNYDGKSVTYTVNVEENSNEITCMIYFNTNGVDTTLPGKTVIFGDKYGSLPQPSANGYIFNGWYTLPVDGDLITSESVVANADSHTLYAHWILDNNTEGNNEVSDDNGNTDNKNDIDTINVDNISNKIGPDIWVEQNATNDLLYDENINENPGTGSIHFVILMIACLASLVLIILFIKKLKIFPKV